VADLSKLPKRPAMADEFTIESRTTEVIKVRHVGAPPSLYFPRLGAAFVKDLARRFDTDKRQGAFARRRDQSWRPRLRRAPGQEGGADRLRGEAF
jgi:hypothetical protein